MYAALVVILYVRHSFELLREATRAAHMMALLNETVGMP